MISVLGNTVELALERTNRGKIAGRGDSCAIEDLKKACQGFARATHPRPKNPRLPPDRTGRNRRSVDGTTAGEERVLPMIRLGPTSEVMSSLSSNPSLAPDLTTRQGAVCLRWKRLPVHTTPRLRIVPVWFRLRLRAFCTQEGESGSAIAIGFNTWHRPDIGKESRAVTSNAGFAGGWVQRPAVVFGTRVRNPWTGLVPALVKLLFIKLVRVFTPSLAKGST
jgi:hypothetical protein